MMDRPDYAEMVGGLKPFFRDGLLKMVHAEFDDDTDPAFNAPVTEVLFLNLKEALTTFGDKKVLLQEYLEGVVKLDGVHTPVTWGVTHEDTRKALILVGWETMKVRYALSLSLDSALAL